jgi:hypothetical protein
MNTVITITIENPDPALLLALLGGSAKNPQTVTKIKMTKNKKTLPSPFKGKKALTIGKKICLECGKEFKPSGNSQKYCSKECKKLIDNQLDKTLIEIELAKKERESKPYELS